MSCAHTLAHNTHTHTHYNTHLPTSALQHKISYNSKIPSLLQRSSKTRVYTTMSGLPTPGSYQDHNALTCMHTYTQMATSTCMATLVYIRSGEPSEHLCSPWRYSAPRCSAWPEQSPSSHRPVWPDPILAAGVS